MIENVVFAPDSWHLGDPNPLDGTLFDAGWVGLYFTDIDDEQFWNGTSKSCLFSIRFNASVPGLEERVADSLRYHSQAGRRIIVGSDQKIDLRALLEQILAKHPPVAGIRETDARYVVHSTSEENWHRIQSDMKLKSPVMLHGEGAECDPIGHRLLGDPDDFLDYIHFAPYQTMHTEYVVLSAQRGTIVCKSDAEYHPGTRIYLDNHEMIKAGLITRDGLHHSKARGTVDLKRFMVFSVEGFTVREMWTPAEFAAYATRRLEEHLSDLLQIHLRSSTLRVARGATRGTLNTTD